MMKKGSSVIKKENYNNNNGKFLKSTKYFDNENSGSRWKNGRRPRFLC